MTPPKVGFLRPPKTEKIDFLKKPDLYDFTKSALQLPGGYLTKCSIPPSWVNCGLSSVCPKTQALLFPFDMIYILYESKFDTNLLLKLMSIIMNLQLLIYTLKMCSPPITLSPSEQCSARWVYLCVIL